MKQPAKFLIDTNIISELRKQSKANPDVLNFFQQAADGNRGLVRVQLGEKQGAIADFNAAARLFQQQGNSTNPQVVLEFIQQLQK